MITSARYTIGIDTVDIERFINWHTYSIKSLQRIYSQEEIEYCLSNPKKSAERFAVRLAAKEAFLKALAQLIPDQPLSLLTICNTVSIVHYRNIPRLFIDWDLFSNRYPILGPLTASVSLTHSKLSATAIVLLNL